MLVILSMAGGVTSYFNRPYSDTRPSIDSKNDEFVIEMQGENVPARLWQDPLKALDEHLKQFQDSGLSPDTHVQRLANVREQLQLADSTDPLTIDPPKPRSISLLILPIQCFNINVEALMRNAADMWRCAWSAHYNIPKNTNSGTAENSRTDKASQKNYDWTKLEALIKERDFYIEHDRSTILHESYNALLARIHGSRALCEPAKPLTPAPRNTTEWQEFHSFFSMSPEMVDNPRSHKKLVLLAMVNSRNYPEDTEKRIRMRHAIMAGLSNEGYYPEDADHIGVFELRSPSESNMTKALFGQSCAKGSFEQNLSHVPYEWFVRDKLNPKNPFGYEEVLVLWVNEDALDDSISKRLIYLLHHIGLAHFQMKGRFNEDPIVFFQKPKQKNIDLKIIGPSGTNTLELMLKELKANLIKRQGADPSPALMQISPSNASKDPIPIYSPYSTVPSEMLLRMVEIDAASEQADQVISSLFKQAGFSFRRTLLTDDVLAKAMLAELARRKVNFTEDIDEERLILFSDRDTAFGRALPRVFISEINEQRIAGHGKNNWSIPQDVISYGYLRGLDGRLITGGSKSNASNAQIPNKNDPALSLMELANGPSQHDYFRRIAFDTLNRNEIDETSVRAVGVLGSDIHDKILILQALRRSFSNAIFFTTDLDAQLLHLNIIDSTRNLLIASSHGLKLDGTLQGSTAPLRNSYQTSAYLATLCALGNKDAGQALEKNSFQPKIYEIGSDGWAYDLTPTRDTGNRSALGDSVSKSNGKWPALVTITFFFLAFMLAMVYFRFDVLHSHLKRLYEASNILNPKTTES